VPLPRFAVVDLETSGFSMRRHRILQIGLVMVEADGRVVDEWSTLVKLRWPFQRVGPTHVHGITRSTLKHAPVLGDVLAQFGTRLDGAIFTAHNADFDSGFLRRAARRRPADDPVRRALDNPLCTLRMSRRLDPDRTRSHRLGDLCSYYGVPLDRPHDALADASATAMILPHLLDGLGITEPSQLEPYYRRG
jgi:DNA polymerase III subunit epsilon